MYPAPANAREEAARGEHEGEGGGGACSSNRAAAGSVWQGPCSGDSSAAPLAHAQGHAGGTHGPVRLCCRQQRAEVLQGGGREQRRRWAPARRRARATAARAEGTGDPLHEATQGGRTAGAGPPPPSTQHHEPAAPNTTGRPLGPQRCVVLSHHLLVGSLQRPQRAVQVLGADAHQPLHHLCCGGVQILCGRGGGGRHAARQALAAAAGSAAEQPSQLLGQQGAACGRGGGACKWEQGTVRGQRESQGKRKAT